MEERRIIKKRWKLMEKQVYFNFCFHCEDLLNGKESAAVIKRAAELLAKHGIKADFYLGEWEVRNMLEYCPEAIETLKRLKMPICYHGDNHVPHPTPDVRIAKLDWEAAVKEMQYWETHKLDRLTGELDPHETGGFAYVKEVFGKPPIITARDPSGAPGAYVRKQMGVKMLGVDGTMLGFPLFWQMGLLWGRTGYTAHDIMTPIQDILAQVEPDKSKFADREHPVKALKHMVENLPPGSLRLVTFITHEADFYYTASQSWRACYAEGNPSRLWSPPFRPEEEIKEVWRVFEELVAYVAHNPNIKAITCEDILNMVEHIEEERIVTAETVMRTTDFLLINWSTQAGSGERRPPEYVNLGDEYLSLADAFQALIYSLAHYAKHSVLPKEVKIREILGPVDTPQTYAPPEVGLPSITRSGFYRTFVDGEDVISAAATVATKITDKIPGIIELKSIGKVNPAEFLYLMAQELRGINQKGRPTPVLLVPSTMLPPHTYVDPRLLTRWSDNIRWFYLLQLWTVKPAKMK